MKQFLLILLFILGTFFVKAQQDPLISHIFNNKTYINPAFAGTQSDICVNLINRLQWFGLEGAPNTTLMNINSPLKMFGINSGIGLTLLNDEIGFEKNFIGMLDYSYHHNLSAGTLSFGLQLGINNKAFDGTWTTPDIAAGSDPAIPSEKDQDLVFDMGIGVAYSIGKFYTGISATHLTQTKFKFSNSEIPFLKRHYYIVSGYNYELPNSKIELKPNILVKSDGSSAQMLINIDALYNKKFWTGVSYRTANGIDIKIGIELFSGIKIGFSYGLNGSEIIKTNSGSYEVMLGYCFNLGFDKIPQKYKSVRFL